jgi:hypothetical protein
MINGLAYIQHTQIIDLFDQNINQLWIDWLKQIQIITIYMLWGNGEFLNE